MIPTDVKELCILHECPDLRTLQMVEFILIRSTQISDETATMSRDDNTTFPRRSIDCHILCSNPLFLCRRTELSGKIVFAYTPHIHGRFGR